MLFRSNIATREIECMIKGGDAAITTCHIIDGGKKIQEYNFPTLNWKTDNRNRHQKYIIVDPLSENFIPMEEDDNMDILTRILNYKIPIQNPK